MPQSVQDGIDAGLGAQRVNQPHLIDRFALHERRQIVGASQVGQRGLGNEARLGAIVKITHRFQTAPSGLAQLGLDTDRRLAQPDKDYTSPGLRAFTPALAGAQRDASQNHQTQTGRQPHAAARQAAQVSNVGCSYDQDDGHQDAQPRLNDKAEFGN